MNRIDFDAMAKQWDQDPTRFKRAKAIAEAIGKQIPITPQMTALEYGCGTGHLGLQMHHLFDQITLADSSPGMLDVVKKKIEQDHIHNADTLLLDLTTSEHKPQPRYDCIFTLMALHHIQDVKGIIKTWHTMLNPGGYLCIADLKKEDGSFHGQGIHVHHGFDQNELTVILKQSGFGEIEVNTPYTFHRETAADTKAFPLFLLSGKKA